MIVPNYPVIPFENETQKLSMLKKWGLASPKAKDMKQLYYKGLFSSDYIPCEVVGYSASIFIVISVFGQLHSIHPDYLAEMQPSKKERQSLEGSSAL